MGDRYPFAQLREGRAAAKLPLRWYNEDVHAGAFALPTFVRKAVGR